MFNLFNSKVEVLGSDVQSIRGQAALLVVTFLDNGTIEVSRSDNHKKVVVVNNTVVYNGETHRYNDRIIARNVARSIVEGYFRPVLSKGKRYNSLYDLIQAA